MPDSLWYLVCIQNVKRFTEISQQKREGFS